MLSNWRQITYTIHTYYHHATQHHRHCHARADYHQHLHPHLRHRPDYKQAHLGQPTPMAAGNQVPHRRSTRHIHARGFTAVLRCTRHHLRGPAWPVRRPAQNIPICWLSQPTQQIPVPGRLCRSGAAEHVVYMPATRIQDQVPAPLLPASGKPWMRVPKQSIRVFQWMYHILLTQAHNDTLSNYGNPSWSVLTTCHPLRWYRAQYFACMEAYHITWPNSNKYHKLFRDPVISILKDYCVICYGPTLIIHVTFSESRPEVPAMYSVNRLSIFFVS